MIIKNNNNHNDISNDSNKSLIMVGDDDTDEIQYRNLTTHNKNNNITAIVW